MPSRSRHASLAWLFVLALASGCDGPEAGADAARPDAEVAERDAGSIDAGPLDAGSVDAGSADAGTLDAGPSDLCGLCAESLCTDDDVACIDDPTCLEAARCTSRCGPEPGCPGACAAPASGFSPSHIREAAGCIDRTDRCQLACRQPPIEAGECRSPGHACTRGGPAALACCGDYECLPPSLGDPSSSTHTCVHDVGESCDLTLANPDASCRFPARCDLATGRCALACWESGEICWSGAACCHPATICPSSGTSTCCVPGGAALPAGQTCCSGSSETGLDGVLRCAP